MHETSKITELLEVIPKEAQKLEMIIADIAHADTILGALTKHGFTEKVRVVAFATLAQVKKHNERNET